MLLRASMPLAGSNPACGAQPVAAKDAEHGEAVEWTLARGGADEGVRRRGDAVEIQDLGADRARELEILDAREIAAADLVLQGRARSLREQDQRSRAATRGRRTSRKRHRPHYGRTCARVNGC